MTTSGCCKGQLPPGAPRSTTSRLQTPSNLPASPPPRTPTAWLLCLHAPKQTKPPSSWHQVYLVTNPTSTFTLASPVPTPTDTSQQQLAPLLVLRRPRFLASHLAACRPHKVAARPTSRMLVPGQVIFRGQRQAAGRLGRHSSLHGRLVQPAAGLCTGSSESPCD